MFDGKVTAAIEQFVCTTPNQDRIYLPPMQMRDVFLCSDFRYGPDDPTLWPQPFLYEYPHLGAIPRRPKDNNDRLSIMWWNPTRSNFFPLENGVLDGLGQLSTSVYWTFQEMSKGLKERVEIYKKKVVIQYPAHRTCKGNGRRSHSYGFFEISVWSHVVQDY